MWDEGGGVVVLPTFLGAGPSQLLPVGREWCQRQQGGGAPTKQAMCQVGHVCVLENARPLPPHAAGSQAGLGGGGGSFYAKDAKSRRKWGQKWWSWFREARGEG